MKRRTIPFGYRYENGAIMINSSSSDIVKEIFSRYLSGDSMLNIAELLNKMHISFCVYCYNVQPGIDIDYATGDSKTSENNTSNDSPNNQQSEEKQNTDKGNIESTTYIKY